MAHVSMMTMPEQGRIPQFDMGDRLRKARETAGISQEQMSVEIGISRRTIVRYEAGSNIPKSALLLWSMRTGVPLEWLTNGEAPPTGDGGGAGVHPLGLEPRTHWFIDGEAAPMAVVTTLFPGQTGNPEEQAA